MLLGGRVSLDRAWLFLRENRQKQLSENGGHSRRLQKALEYNRELIVGSFFVQTFALIV